MVSLLFSFLWAVSSGRKHLATATSTENSRRTHHRDFALHSSESPGRLQTAIKGVEPFVCADWIHHKFTKSGISDRVFQPSADHETWWGCTAPSQTAYCYLNKKYKKTSILGKRRNEDAWIRKSIHSSSSQEHL